MKQSISDLIREAIRLIGVDRTDEAVTLLNEVLDREQTDGGAQTMDGGGSNPTGPGQSGHP